MEKFRTSRRRLMVVGYNNWVRIIFYDHDRERKASDLLVEARLDGWMIHVHGKDGDRIGGLMISDDGTANYTPERN